MTSIRQYLLTVLLSVITLIVFIAALQGYRQSMSRTGELFDAELVSIASILAMSALPQQFSASYDDLTVNFQVWKDGSLLLKSKSAPDQAISKFKPGFDDRNFSGYRWRTYSLYQESRNQWVFVAQKVAYRVELAEKIILSSVYPIILTIPIVALLIWFILSNGLKPLKSISRQLTLREADNLDSIQLQSPPQELETVVNTINGLFGRLRFSFEREKRFAGDAAHELRTPLSVLKLNIHNLEQELGLDSKHEGMLALKQGTERMAHVVNQVLSLYRTSPDQFSANIERVDLLHLCQQAIADYYPEILVKRQDVELVGESAMILGDKFSLASLLQNLISNASKYTPLDGNILITIIKAEQHIELSIEDSGEGIAEELWQQVFMRFYRVGGDQHSSGAPGCGLGLSIVQHIVDLHCAKIQLAHSRFDTGLKMSIIFNLPDNELFGNKR